MNMNAEQLDHVLELMTACASGQTDPRQVERAVQSVLVAAPEIQIDTGNYDDDDDDDTKDNVQEEEVKVEPPQSTTTTTTTTTANTINNDLYQHIPLGIAGAHMLVTFGAGATPRPETVDTALQLTRRCIQHAIRQAKDIRKQRQEAFLQARVTLKSDIYKTKQLQRSLHTCSSEWQYRVLVPHDPASSSSGDFDLEDLQCVFPEQVHAYLQWNERLAEYQRKKEDNDDEEEEEEEDTAVTSHAATTTTTTTGGHLAERAAHLDQRTCDMKEDWYLQFAQVIRTKGSFLPARDTALHSTRFWHWIREDTTVDEPHPVISKAVAFLAFDFLGRIIEEAIFYKTKKRSELPTDQTLSPDDLLQAVQHHPELKELTSTDHAIPKAPQLYFGPGFEVRLEMEMEEMLAQSTSAPADSPSQGSPKKRARSSS